MYEFSGVCQSLSMCMLSKVIEVTEKVTELGCRY